MAPPIIVRTEVAAAEEAEEAAPEAPAAAAATAVASIDGDAKAGKRVWRKCQACHKMGDGAKNAVGPQLNNIIGRTIGGVDGFKYSDGFIALRDEGKVWTVEALDEWLLKPRDYIAGTKMAFGGLRKEADRQNVIAYMNEEGQ
jgi:cytochrome c